MIDLEELNERLSYNPVTGVFRHKINAGSRVRAGEKAGHIDNDWLRIGFGRCKFRATILAWYMYYGEWPEHKLTVKNGDKRDLSIKNIIEIVPKCRSVAKPKNRCRKLRMPTIPIKDRTRKLIISEAAWIWQGKPNKDDMIETLKIVLNNPLLSDFAADSKTIMQWEKEVMRRAA